MSFAHPEVFLLIALVPLMLLGAILANRSRGRAWKRLVSARLRPILVTSSSPAPRWISYGLSLGAFILVITAMAGPNAGYRQQTDTIQGRNLLLAIDISRSMLAEDESPNRLAAALAAALEVIDHFPNERIGLIAFSGTSFLVAPLTIDHAAIRESLGQLDPATLRELDADFLPRGGSNIAEAVRLGTDTLKATGQRSNALIVFSDGEVHEGGIEDAADTAENAGITIFTVGFGSAEGAFIPDLHQADKRYRDRRGDLVFTRLKPDEMLLLARRTGGFYTRGSGRHFAPNLETAVAQLDRFEIEGKKRQVAIPRFQWFLLPAIILFIASILVNTPWRLTARSAVAGLALCCLVPAESEARLLPATGAERAYESGDYEFARELFASELAEARGERRARLQLGAGATAYRLGDFPRASAAYSDALLSTAPGVQEQAHYALGNSLYFRGLGQIEAAGEAAGSATVTAVIALWTDALGHYQGALAITPGHKEATENHRIVKKHLEDLKARQAQQEQEDQDEPEDPDQQEDPDEPTPDEQSDNPDEQAGDDNSKDEQPEDQQDPNSEEDPNKGGDQEQENPTPDSQAPNGQDPNQQDKQAPRDQLPDESPEEYASRILAENADFQTTPLLPHRLTPQRPEKDW